MRIAIVPPFEESVPPKSYGGTELVAYNIIEQLVKKGHEVSLIGSADSVTSATLLPTFPQSLRANPLTSKYRERFKYIGIGRILNILDQHSFDIVHNHLGWRLLPFRKYIHAPMVTTIHGPLNVKDQQIVLEDFKQENFVSLSHNQRHGMPDLNYVGNVYNGIDVDRFSVGLKERSYLAFLGRLAPEKNPLDAIAVAKLTGRKLKIAAKIDMVDREFFDKKVKPLIDGEQIQYIGEVNHEQKVAFLGGAQALLMPIVWEEPFGLVNIEALACGTPILAYPRGSLSEIVENGKTGYLCQSVEEMAQRVEDLHTLKAQDCRKAVEERFSAERMTEEYLSIFQSILS